MPDSSFISALVLSTAFWWSWWARIFPIFSPRSYVLLCDLFIKFSMCFVDSRLNSVWRVNRSLNKSSDGVTASVVSNLRISFVSCSSFILWRFLCCVLYDIICPLRCAFMDSHTVKGDIPGVWLCSRKKVISEEINLMKSSSESSKVLRRQGW